MSYTRQPEIIQVIVGCTEIPEVDIDVEIPRVQIEIPKLNVGGGKVGIQINPPTPKPTPTPTPTDKPTVKPTAFGEGGNNGIPFVSAETPMEEPTIIKDLPGEEPPIELPIPDDGGVWV